MGTQPMRIRLNLTGVETPPYKYVWFPVSPCAFNTISDLKSSICKKFNLEQASVQLFVEGGLMRDEDTVLLLRENDVVQVLYTHENSLQSEVQSKENICSTVSQETQYVRKAHKRRNNFDDSGSCSSKSGKIEISNQEKEVDVSDSQVDVCLPRKKKKSKKNKEVGFNQNCDFEVVHHDLGNMELFPIKDTPVATDVGGADDILESSLKSKVKCKKHKKKKEYPESCSTPVESSRSNFEQCDVTSASINADISSVSLNVDFDANKHMKLSESTPMSTAEKHKVQVSSSKKAKDESSTEPLRSSNCKKKKRRKRKRKRKSDLSCPSLDITPDSFLAKVAAPIETSNLIKKGTHIKFLSCSDSENSELEAGDTFTMEGKTFPQKSKSSDLEPKTTIERKLVSCSQSKDLPLMSAMHFKAVNLTAMKKHFNFSPCVESNDSVIETSVNSDPSVLNETHVGDSETDKCKNNNVSIISVQESKCQSSTPESSVQVNGLSASVGNYDTSEVVSSEKKLVSADKPDYSSYSALNTLPPVGTHIAFKILELSELYCPEVSSYKEGIIVDFNSATDDVTIELTQHELKAPRNGKFENLYPDDVVQPEVVNKVTAKWPELIEPRLISAAEK